jgi:hypothetical protein
VLEAGASDYRVKTELRAGVELLLKS